VRVPRRCGKTGPDHSASRAFLIPVNAAIDQLEVILVLEADQDVNPAGVTGIGELADVGTAAAIANAVSDATGKRVRELPIRIAKLLCEVVGFLGDP
jgi:CO/xanthine dehydrogenase Mo-binding subunit